MKKGLVFSGGGMSIRQMVEIAQEAEAAGLDSIFVTEAWRSAFVPLAAIAMGTERVELGTYIMNAYARSPWLAGMSAIDVDELSGGRLVLGIGTGNKHINEEWQGVPQERPLRKMDEYVTLLKKIFATSVGEELRYEGEMHRMQWPPAVQPLRRDIPVYLAGLFPKMVKVAGRVSDGLAMGALLSPAYIRDQVMAQARQAAADAGRDPAALGSILAPFVAVADTTDKARQMAREAICHLYAPLPHPYYDFVIREQGFTKAADAASKLVPEGKFEQATEAFTDDIIDVLTISGTVEECRAKLADYEGVVDHLLFVNVNFSAGTAEQLMRTFREMIKIGAA